MTTLISKPETAKRRYQVHIMKNGRPLCGGGKLARLTAAWQIEIGDPTCKRCKKYSRLYDNHKACA